MADRRGTVFDDLVPAWLFAARPLPIRLAVAFGVTALTTSPLWLNSDPSSVRLAPLLVLGLVVVAGTAGSLAVGLAGAVVLPWYWYSNIPETSSFELQSAGEAFSVGAMAVLVVGLVVLTVVIERSVADVKRLDETRQLDQVAATAAMLDAENNAALIGAALMLSNDLSGVANPAEVAEVALAGLSIPAAPTSASIAIVAEGRLRILAARHADPRSIRALERADLGRDGWFRRVLDGEPMLIDHRDQFATEHPNADVLQLYPVGSWATIPFRSEGTVGLLSVYFAEGQPLTPHRLYFSLVSEIIATALQRAAAEAARASHLAELQRTLAERDRIARTLSTTLLPPRLPAVPGFEASAWLVPASSDEVAGDFYDLFALADGGWVAVLGDVCGKGAEAAAVTSLARYAARVTALDDPDPARIADVANAALVADQSELFCTMALVRFVPEANRLDVTLAGHQQARLVRPDGKVDRLGAFGAALGFGTQGHRTTSHPFGPGEVVVLFSDGLVERNGAFGEDELDDHLAGAARDCGTADELAHSMRTRVLALEAERADDLTVLVIARR